MLAWSPEQSQRVREILERYPPESNDCALAAQELVPYACELDQGARAMLIEPPRHGPPGSRRAKGPYLVLKVGPTRWWTHHVTTELSAHCVDSLTGVPGFAQVSYLEHHFEYADILVMTPVEEDQWDEL